MGGGIGGRFILSAGIAASTVGAAFLLTAASARAEPGLSSYVRPPGTWHEIAPGDSPLRFGGIDSVVKVFVDDGWTSRYQIEADFADGGLVHYEKPAHPYSTGISLRQVFYQIYGHDDALAAHGITPGIDEAAIAAVGNRPIAYLARQGKDAVCFAFVSQFGGPPSGTAESGRERMLNGAVCRPLAEGDADALARRWLALLEAVVVP